MGKFRFMKNPIKKGGENMTKMTKILTLAVALFLFAVPAKSWAAYESLYANAADSIFAGDLWTGFEEVDLEWGNLCLPRVVRKWGCPGRLLHRLLRHLHQRVPALQRRRPKSVLGFLERLRRFLRESQGTREQRLCHMVGSRVCQLQRRLHELPALRV
jgi:hypothetical protein